jgi:predicted alpha/beta superfamily hydrolase
MKTIISAVTSAALFLCLASGTVAQALKTGSVVAEVKEIKSKLINESYTISVSLPAAYDSQKKYPVIYLLDSNIYFDIVAQILRHYRESANMPEAILVGIGYSDYATTDKLRSRDFTYPPALPEYKLPFLTGGAKEFLAFINSQVVPFIDAHYAADPRQRILMGHSLGGYFTSFAMHENLAANNDVFSGYIAASPTVFYNNNYLIKKFADANFKNEGKTKIYISFGDAEDAEFAAIVPMKRVDILAALENSIQARNNINFKGESFTHLAHTDTPLPTFIKGINIMLKK